MHPSCAPHRHTQHPLAPAMRMPVGGCLIVPYWDTLSFEGARRAWLYST